MNFSSTVINLDVIIGAVIGAVLSSIGFIIKNIIDQINLRKKLINRIKVLCDLCSIAYNNYDHEKSQILLAELFHDYAERYKKYDKQLFISAFNISYKSDDNSILFNELINCIKNIKYYHNKKNDSNKSISSEVL